MIATVPLTVRTPPMPTPTVVNAGTVSVLPAAMLLVVLDIAAAVKLQLFNVVFAFATNLVVQIVLVAPVKVSVPVPATVKEAKLPVVGIADGIPDTVKVPLQVSVTSSPATGAPAGVQAMDPYAMLALMVAVFTTALLWPAKNKRSRVVSKVIPPVRDFRKTLATGVVNVFFIKTDC